MTTLVASILALLIIGLNLWLLWTTVTGSGA